MDLLHAEMLARTLIDQYVPDYSFAWSYHKTVNGRCSYQMRTIYLSRPRTPLRTREAVEQTIMHEIAHAKHPGAGHGPIWQMQMRNFGYSSERCSSDVIDRSSISNWAANCPVCGKVSYMFRKPRQRKSCGRCSNGRFNTKYELIFNRL